MSSAPFRTVYSVTRLCVEANLVLDHALPSLWLEGELSGVRKYPSGHYYFNVKDETAVLSCTLWKNKALRSRIVPRDGLKVLMYGKAGVYSASGRFQFSVDLIEDAGEGALRRRYEDLKAALAAEGLFDAAAKRDLPALPRRIGVITSPAGAALRDILHILKRRFPSIPVLIYPVPVQGAAAAGEIARTLALASARADVDVIILARGGGSLEDLWSFNEEIVARAIRACAIPVVAGVGHETDTTIADFAADVRAPTPSAAAELVVPDQSEWQQRLNSHRQRLVAVTRRIVGGRIQQLRFLGRRLSQAHPRHRLRERVQRLDELDLRLASAVQRCQTAAATRLAFLDQRLANAHPRQTLLSLNARLRDAEARLQRAIDRHRNHISTRVNVLRQRLVQVHPGRRVRSESDRLHDRSARLQQALRLQLQRSRSRFETAVRTLHVVSPLATLERGYAIVTDDTGAVVRNANDVEVGAHIEARVGKGRLRARVSEQLD